MRVRAGLVAVLTIGAGGVAVIAVIDADWGGGYCVRLEATNVRDEATVDWASVVNTNQSTIYTSSNAAFSPSSGSITVLPHAAHRVIAPMQTSSSVSFCANRVNASSGTLPFIVGAAATY